MRIPRSFLRVFILGRDKWVSEIRPLFSLKDDFDEPGTVESIERAVEFKGANVWILIFAIFIASIGLNVNSTAVIIGAMLISPLMGPIVGAGLALGINHFDLLKKALRNLVIASALGVITSFLYFLISPLAVAQSELLARTQPTIYDVLIALFGGATGIIAGTRKERAFNAISGVAIATALMPPLCTAGFGIARGDFGFFLGAIYLYAINSVFICMATVVVVRALHFKKHMFVDVKTERRVGYYMTAISILIAVPSIYTAYQSVSEVVFHSRANKFLNESFQFNNTRILERRFERRKEGNLIELTLIGSPLDTSDKEKMRERLRLYHLSGTTLTFNEAGSGSIKELELRLSQSLKTEFLEKLYQNDQSALKSRDEKIRFLEDELLKHTKTVQLVGEIGLEANVLNEKVQSLSLGQMPGWSKLGGKPAQSTVAILYWKGRPSKAEKTLIERFIRTRLKDENCEILHL